MSATQRPFAIADESRSHSLGSSALRLTLDWRDDRWSHGLELGRASIVRAIEPTVDDESNRFAFPVFQQASLSAEDDFANDFLALLVGQHGRRHASASFLVDQIDAGRLVVAVDLALRGTEPFSLACTYLVEASSSELIEADGSRIVWSPRGGEGRLILEATSDDLSTTTLALAEAGRRATLVQAIARFDPRSLTQRSRYRWIWQPAHVYS